MRAWFITILYFFIFFAAPALAGPWMREQGSAFVSSSVNAGRDGASATNTYIEYGLRPRTTIGAELMMDRSDAATQNGIGGIFLLRPLGSTNRDSKWSLKLGLGARWDDRTVSPYVQGGLAWGRGLKWGERYGWAAVEASIKWETGTGKTVTKVDTTIGMGIADQTKTMLQVFLHDDSDGATATLAPSLLFQPKQRKFTVQVGAEFATDGDPSLKLGLWREF